MAASAHRAAVVMHAFYAERALGRGPGAPSFIEAIAEACGARSIAVTLFGAGAGESVVATSDPLAESAQDLEYSYGEGPAVKVLTGPGELSLSGGELSRCWPRFGAAIQDLGVVSVSSVRLGGAASPLGAVTVYRSEAADGALLTRSLAAVAEALTNTALLPIAGVEDLLAHPLFDDLDFRPVVHQAAGMVMMAKDCAAEDALALIRAHALAEDRRVLDVSLAIVDRTLDLP
ncbi:ANTAR domain-containing protein [Amycolatopsis saalfeldensis]|uniref:ANTAR domain-containing protein n=1 Tax=Amycolatopsis saalfeldensis TaxID=394193 RepID=A0A1H8YL46_9PSEU|nr:ANTAR domain-containing protein [Amycolatopsis saalfeldensis]SEP52944.1 ANTAR domain-containing protein [Amycolatopsis saalfeldensis]